MAYMNQERKKPIFEAMKKLLDPKLGWKFTMAVNNHSTLVLNITRGPVDFIGAYTHHDPQHLASVKARGHLDINHYWYQEHFAPDVVELLREIVAVMNDGNHDNSDIQTDYFDVGWYIDVNIGNWKKPYELIYAQKEAA